MIDSALIEMKEMRTEGAKLAMQSRSKAEAYLADLPDTVGRRSVTRPLPLDMVKRFGEKDAAADNAPRSVMASSVSCIAKASNWLAPARKPGLIAAVLQSAFCASRDTVELESCSQDGCVTILKIGGPFICCFVFAVTADIMSLIKGTSFGVLGVVTGPRDGDGFRRLGTRYVANWAGAVERILCAWSITTPSCVDAM